MHIGSQRKVALRIENSHENDKQNNIQMIYSFANIWDWKLFFFLSLWFNNGKMKFSDFKPGENKEDLKGIANAQKTTLWKQSHSTGGYAKCERTYFNI